MEDKTKSTIAHVATIATALGAIVTSLVTASSNDAKGEKIYEVLKERVSIQGEQIEWLKEENRELRAWLMKGHGFESSLKSNDLKAKRDGEPTPPQSERPSKRSDQAMAAPLPDYKGL